MTAIDYSGNLARGIKQHREARRMSQTDLAKAMKEQGFPFHQPTVQRIEAGVREVRVPELFGFASALRVTPQELIGQSGIDPDAELMKATFCDVARAVVTGQMDERINLAWRVFFSSIQGGAAS